MQTRTRVPALQLNCNACTHVQRGERRMGAGDRVRQCAVLKPRRHTSIPLKAAASAGHAGEP